MMKAIELKGEQGDFYDWCQELRNGNIDADTLLVRTVKAIHNLEAEESGLVGRLLERGWIPPEEAKGYVKLAGIRCELEEMNVFSPYPNSGIFIEDCRWQDFWKGKIGEGWIPPEEAKAGYKSNEEVYDLTMRAKKSGWDDCVVWHKAEGYVKL